MIDSLLDAVSSLMSSPWVYLLIALVALADALIPLAPSETVVITAGVFAASGSDMLLVIASAAAGALAGDHLSYLIGRLMSRWTAERDPAGWQARTLSRADSLLAERRGMALVVARYIPGGRTAVTLGMGALRHPLADFSRWDAVAALSWAAYCTAIGAIGGAAFAEDPLPAVVLGVAIALGIAALTELVRHRRRPQRAIVAAAPRNSDTPLELELQAPSPDEAPQVLGTARHRDADDQRDTGPRNLASAALAAHPPAVLVPVGASCATHAPAGTASPMTRR
ncbi:DedA family protein [Modestobacter sp. VKM Ac-2978]|uniref:DedA family protein n=1 Tax=Modestobacter sp. VKM Ac-2978 TaxID=3004132 RepID=UPI0022AA1AB8|nr:DedA family protein [Modestobacter sp. VKM Ac-2978]MCZ2849932.1 DedA family protein [Modestobacter sp. VKM Ac-2978]